MFSDFKRITETNRFAIGTSTANTNVSKNFASNTTILSKTWIKTVSLWVLYRYIYHSCTVLQIHLQQSTTHEAKDFRCENFIDCSKRQNCSVPVIQLLMQNLKEKKRFLMQT